MCLFSCGAACCQALLMPFSVAMASPSLELAEFSQVSRQLNSLDINFHLITAGHDEQ
jgi:predicted double-glycine peptidase